MTKKTQGLQRRRPRQARARMTCDSILEAAILVIARDGAEGLNTNAVAERAGVSIGTLYQYFPDKDAILLAAARRELAKAVTPQRSLIEALIRALESLLGAPRVQSATRSLRRSADVMGDGSKRLASVVEDFLFGWVLPPMPVHRAVRVR